jgi:16S rRNA (cytosine967-C5)-methyltransferase
MTGPTGRPEATPPSRDKHSRDKPGHDKPGHDKPSRDKAGRDKADRAGRDNPGGTGRRGRAGGKRRAERADPARRAVFDVLLAVAKRGAYANLLLPSVLRERRLGGRDAALATELCYGTLRGQGTYDAILSICSDRRIARMDPPVREVLRLGVHQLLATRVATHAAVATSVDLAKDVAGVRPAGFVNAVLRRVSTRDLDDWMAVVAPGRQADPVGYLAIRHSYPPWIVTAFGEALGELPLAGTNQHSTRPSGDAPAGGLVETEAALAAGNVGPRVTLCAIPGASAPGELTAAAGSEPARWSPFGVYLGQGDPAAITAVSQRRATVQDEASQLAALALTRAEVAGPDRLWLDMCAGPGGKAALLAGIGAGRGARLLAADARQHRAALAKDALTGSAPTAPADTEPTGTTTTAGVVAADGTAPAWRQGVFDRVLADVPCSGLGSLRRRPEARWRRSADHLAELAPLQRSLLRVALASVRPGGVVAYVTCSPHLAETRDVVADVLGGRQDVELLDAPALLPEVPDLAALAPFSKHIQFWPHRHKTDAIFLALIRRLD